MKKILFLVLISLFSETMSAQTTYSMTNYSTNVLKDGNYIKDIDGLMDKFVGTWKYTNGNEEFTIHIIKVEHTNFSDTRDFYKDALFGGYKYIKNGNIVVDKINFTTDTNDIQNCAIMFGSGSFSNNFNTISLLGDDAVVHKPVDIDLSVISDTEMTWKMIPRENININNSLPTPGDGFSIPLEITLTKQ